MPARRVVRLPGVGARLDLTDAAGAVMHVVRSDSGRVVLHAANSPPIELDPANAVALGTFVSGHYALDPELSARLQDVLGGLAFEWVRIPVGAVAAGRTIEELAVRRRTGITIVAILRGAQPIVAPDPQERLAAGDDLVVVGRLDDLEPFRRYVTQR